MDGGKGGYYSLFSSNSIRARFTQESGWKFKKLPSAMSWIIWGGERARRDSLPSRMHGKRLVRENIFTVSCQISLCVLTLSCSVHTCGFVCLQNNYLGQTQDCIVYTRNFSRSIWRKLMIRIHDFLLCKALNMLHDTHDNERWSVELLKFTFWALHLN